MREHYNESQDCFKYPNKSLVKSSHQKQNLPTFPTKNPGIEKFRPKKPFDHPRHSRGERSREPYTASGAKGTMESLLVTTNKGLREDWG